jgi:hypothetical protein
MTLHEALNLLLLEGVAEKPMVTVELLLSALSRPVTQRECSFTGTYLLARH